MSFKFRVSHILLFGLLFQLIFINTSYGSRKPILLLQFEDNTEEIRFDLAGSLYRNLSAFSGKSKKIVFIGDQSLNRAYEETMTYVSTPLIKQYIGHKNNDYFKKLKEMFSINYVLIGEIAFFVLFESGSSSSKVNLSLVNLSDASIEAKTTIWASSGSGVNFNFNETRYIDTKSLEFKHSSMNHVFKDLFEQISTWIEDSIGNIEYKAYIKKVNDYKVIIDGGSEIDLRKGQKYIVFRNESYGYEKEIGDIVITKALYFQSFGKSIYPCEFKIGDYIKLNNK